MGGNGEILGQDEKINVFVDVEKKVSTCDSSSLGAVGKSNRQRRVWTRPEWEISHRRCNLGTSKAKSSFYIANKRAEVDGRRGATSLALESDTRTNLLPYLRMRGTDGTNIPPEHKSSPTTLEIP